MSPEAGCPPLKRPGPVPIIGRPFSPEAGGPNDMRRPLNRPLLALVLAGLLAFGAGGCCTVFAICPVPPPLERARVETALAEQAARFRTVTDADISLKIAVIAEDGSEERVPSLGGVLAFDSLLPGLWLRAEKFGQKAFGLRARADGFWLEFPQTREVVTGSAAAYAALPHLIHPHEAVLWFGAAERLGLIHDTTRMTLESEDYRFDAFADGRTVWVDRRRVVISRIVEYDRQGYEVLEVDLERYKHTGELEFPRRVTVWRPQAGYRVRLGLGRPKLNKVIPSSAFEPLPRPGWRHIDLDRQPLSDVEAFGGKR